MTVLDKVLGAQVRQLILALDVVGADLALLHQLHEKIPQRDVLCTKTVGQQVDDGPLGVVVDYLAGVLVVAYGH